MWHNYIIVSYRLQAGKLMALMAGPPFAGKNVLRVVLCVLAYVPEHIPLEMETGVGGASRWNTLRAVRVPRWYNNSTCSL